MSIPGLGLEGKVVVVTGGNKGIGASIVELLEQLGAKVAYTYRSGTGSDTALAIQADVTDYDQMAAAADQIKQELGPIYGLVANAGITKDGFFVKSTREQWDAVINTNLTGVYNTVRPIMPIMTEAGEGSIVLISSIVGERGNLGQANYAAAKGGVITFGKTLALEGARFGVRSNIIAPGFIRTAMVDAIPEKVQDRITAEIPMRRFGEPSEIAWGSAYLLSPASSYVTGTVLSINGGHYM